MCRVCGNEKRYDEYRRLYKPCDSCNTKRALKFYYNNKDKILEKKKKHYHNNKDFFSEQYIQRKIEIAGLENQIKTTTEMIKTTISVA